MPGGSCEKRLPLGSGRCAQRFFWRESGRGDGAQLGRAQTRWMPD